MRPCPRLGSHDCSRVLACAASNIAVDNLVERLAKQDPRLSLVRVGHPARLLPQVRCCEGLWGPDVLVQSIMCVALVLALALAGRAVSKASASHLQSSASQLGPRMSASNAPGAAAGQACATPCRCLRTAWRRGCLRPTTRRWRETAAAR
jgi:hypothetical protein